MHTQPNSQTRSHRRITVGFDPFTHSSLDSLAWTLQISCSEIIRLAIEELLISASRRPEAKYVDDFQSMRASLGDDNVFQSSKRAALAHFTSGAESDSRRPGPTKKYNNRLSVTVSNEIFEGLDTYCADKRVGLATAVRSAVDYYLSKHIYDSDFGDIQWGTLTS